ALCGGAPEVEIFLHEAVTAVVDHIVNSGDGIRFGKYAGNIRLVIVAGVVEEYAAKQRFGGPAGGAALFRGRNVRILPVGQIVRGYLEVFRDEPVHLFRTGLRNVVIARL